MLGMYWTLLLLDRLCRVHHEARETATVKAHRIRGAEYTATPWDEVPALTRSIERLSLHALLDELQRLGLLNEVSPEELDARLRPPVTGPPI